MMIPKGLAAAVLATLPEQAGVPGGEAIKYITYSVVLISILITSILILLNNKKGVQKIYGYFWNNKNKKTTTENEFAEPVSNSTIDIFDIASKNNETTKTTE